MDWIIRLAASVCAVSAVFLLALFVVQRLSGVGKDTQGDITASVKKAGIMITVKGAGLFGAFLGLILCGCLMIYFLMKS